MNHDVCVIGAGIIGITSALELQARGADVVLIDSRDPGRQTSFGNAGVLSASTVLNVNNPGLWRALPGLLTGKSPYFRYELGYVVSRLPWLLAFFANARKRHSLATARKLHELQSLSIVHHDRLMAEAGAESLYQAQGWLKVFRDKRGFSASALERHLLQELNIPFQCVSKEELAQVEPVLNPIYHSGLLLSATRSVTDPYLLCKSYFDLYCQRGGRFELFNVSSITAAAGEYTVETRDDRAAIKSQNIVVACGPWSTDVCEMLGYNIPMAWERGYHVNVESPSTRLGRPVCDVQRGFVMAPQGKTTRITSGVEFVHRDAAANHSQVLAAFRDAKMAAPIGGMTESAPWLGSRPTLPDSLPAIGAAPRHNGIWFNFGHQHLGMSVSTGSAEILADEMLGQSKHEMSRAFSPQRFRM